MGTSPLSFFLKDLRQRRGLFHWDLVHPVLMPPTFEGGSEKLVENAAGGVVVYKSAGHDEHVGIVVLADEVGYLPIPSQSGAHALVFVQRHGNAFSATANADAGIHFAALDALGQGVGKVGIVATLIAVGAVIFIGVATLFKILQNVLFEGKSCVIASNSDGFYFHTCD